MMGTPLESSDLHILPRELAGEDALLELPLRPGLAVTEYCIEGGNLDAVDAYGGAALRARVEYCARYRQRQVTIMPPRNTRAWSLVYATLANDAPRHLVLPNHKVASPGKAPRSVIVPAIPVSDVGTALAIGDMVVGQAAGEFRRQLGFLGAHLPELVDNALRWASDSPIKPVVCVMHDRTTDRLQLVVVDLGERISRRGDAADAIMAALKQAPEGSLQSLVEEASYRGLDAEVGLAAGLGRVRWTTGQWTEAGGSDVHGFAVAVSLPAALP
jgi:hypothetical protein